MPDCCTATDEESTEANEGTNPEPFSSGRFISETLFKKVGRRALCSGEGPGTD